MSHPTIWKVLKKVHGRYYSTYTNLNYVFSAAFEDATKYKRSNQEYFISYNPTQKKFKLLVCKNFNRDWYETIEGRYELGGLYKSDLGVTYFSGGEIRSAGNYLIDYDNDTTPPLISRIRERLDFMEKHEYDL